MLLALHYIVHSVAISFICLHKYILLLSVLVNVVGVINKNLYDCSIRITPIHRIFDCSTKVYCSFKLLIHKVTDT